METGTTGAVVIDTRYGYLVLILTMLVFNIINRIVTWYGRPDVVVATDDWKWKNLLISWIHALVISAWDLSCFFLFPDLFSDLITWANYYTYYCVAVSTGYFLYDFCDMIANNQVFKLWEITLHHIAVTSMFFFNVVTGQCIAFNMIALLAEVNSFFLHSRKLLQMLNVGFKHWLYRVTAVLNILTFAVFRGLSLGGITYGIFTWSHRVSKLYVFALSGSMVIMNIINPILFWRLLKNDFLRTDEDFAAEKCISNGDVNHIVDANHIGNHTRKHINGDYNDQVTKYDDFTQDYVKVNGNNNKIKSS